MISKIGITGHQERDGIDWRWVRLNIRTELSRMRHVEAAYSSLAAGSDQIFAETALDLSIKVFAVIPMEGYERFFKGKNLAKYRRLLGCCEALQLKWRGDEERAFFEAGKHIVDCCDTIIAVWDGKKAEGFGGTGDVVAYAEKSSKYLIHINPIEFSVARI